MLPRPILTKDSFKAQTIEIMVKMGTYKEEYDPIIDIYSGLREQYARLVSEFSDGSSYKYSTQTSDGGEKKSPLSLTLESLRKDVLAYSDRLMLNPKARADAGSKPEKKSKLAGLLSDGK